MHIASETHKIYAILKYQRSLISFIYFLSNLCLVSPLQLVGLSESQDVEAGDGTTSVVVVAGALLQAAEELLKKVSRHAELAWSAGIFGGERGSENGYLGEDGSTEHLGLFIYHNDEYLSKRA